MGPAAGRLADAVRSRRLRRQSARQRARRISRKGPIMFKPGLFKGKRILVTGGGTGLGREMAAKYLELGAELTLCGRRKSVLDNTAAEMMAQRRGKFHLAYRGPLPARLRRHRQYRAARHLLRNPGGRQALDLGRPPGLDR